MSFVDDLSGATTDLEGLRAFDSNGDGKISSTDKLFGDFKIWVDRNGDGVANKREILGLCEIGLASITLTGTPTHLSAKPGDVAVVNAGTWTMNSGRTMQLADAAMTFYAQSDGVARASAPTAPLPGMGSNGDRWIPQFLRNGFAAAVFGIFGEQVGFTPGLRQTESAGDHMFVSERSSQQVNNPSTLDLDGILDRLRRENLFGELDCGADGVALSVSPLGSIWSDATRAGDSAASQSADLPIAQHMQLYSTEPPQSEIEVDLERRLASMAQDLASFGGSASARVELRQVAGHEPLNLFAA
jgi:hypothetical protein